MSNIPSSFMERFCHTIDPQLDGNAVCVNWFLYAAKHCDKLMNTSNRRGPIFWETMKAFMSEEQSTEVISMKQPIRFHPSRMTLHDCELLYQDIVNDYMLKAHRFSAESMENDFLWQILSFLMVFMLLGCMLLGGFKLYKRRGYIKKTEPNASDPQICNEKVASRSLLAKEVGSRLKVLPRTKPKGLIAADGTPIMVIKGKNKFDFLDSVVTGSVATKSHLYNLHDPYGKLKIDYKLQSVRNVLKFVGLVAKKLNVLIVFEEEPLTNDTAENKIDSGDLGSGNSTASSAGDSPRIVLPKSNRTISVHNQTLTSPRSGLSRSPTNRK